MIYFSASSLSFYPKAWKDDGSYAEDKWPADAVLLSNFLADIYWRKTPPQGKILGSKDGRPAWVDAPPPRQITSQEIENIRRREYADPILGSDRMFSESTRMQIMGETGYEEVRARAIARFEEIKAKYPWPSK